MDTKTNTAYSTVYTNDGHPLGNEWVNLKGLELDTKKAIHQLIYLDKLAQQAKPKKD